MIEIMLLASLFGSHTGIIVPDSCNSCPTYDEINQIFPDNIDPKLRDMEHGWKFYLMKPGNVQYIWVNPPIHVHDKIKTITFVPELKPFDGSQYMDDGHVQFKHTRWHSPSCQKVVLDIGDKQWGVDHWSARLGDTMWFMHNACDPAHTNMDTDLDIHVYTPEDYLTPWGKAQKNLEEKYEEIRKKIFDALD